MRLWRIGSALYPVWSAEGARLKGGRWNHPGIPAIYAHKYGIPIVAVTDNDTILGVSAERVGIGNAIEVGSYAEAAGVLLALKRGISLESIRRPLPTHRHRFGESARAERRFRVQLA